MSKDPFSGSPLTRAGAAVSIAKRPGLIVPSFDVARRCERTPVQGEAATCGLNSRIRIDNPVIGRRRPRRRADVRGRPLFSQTQGLTVAPPPLRTESKSKDRWRSRS